MRKSADEKSLIAAFARAETSVKASWLAGRLQMGSVAKGHSREQGNRGSLGRRQEAEADSEGGSCK